MKKWLSLILAACMMLSLTACGGGNNNGGSGNNGGSSDDGGASAGEKKESIVVANSFDADTFYPYNSAIMTNQDECPILHNVYESPFKLMPDGTTEPLLAESYELSEDGTEYTLHLRDDVYFHNGKKMTAEDVAGSLNISGASAVGQTLLINYDTTEVVDENTVVVKLTAPYGPFLTSLASRVALVIDVDYLEEVGEEGYEAAPIGTGPYTFVERVSGDHITLQANEDYWGGAPTYKTVTVRLMTDINTQMLALESGEVDVLLNASLSPLLMLPEDSPVKYVSTDAATIGALSLNSSYPDSPCSDLNFRKAIQAGINKDDINIGIFEGEATLTDIYMTPTFTGRPDDADLHTYTYDPEAAAEYLAASGYNGEEIVLATVSGTRNETVSQIIQGQLMALGINCTVNAVDSSSFFQLVTYGDGSGWDLALRAGTVSVLDADGLYTLFNGDYLDSTGNYGTGSIRDARLTELTALGRVTTDEEERKAIYAEACNIVTDQAYMIPMYCEMNIVAFNENVEGVQPRALTGVYFFNEWF